MPLTKKTKSIFAQLGKGIIKGGMSAAEKAEIAAEKEKERKGSIFGQLMKEYQPAGSEDGQPTTVGSLMSQVGLNAPGEGRDIALEPIPTKQEQELAGIQKRADWEADYKENLIKENREGRIKIYAGIEGLKSKVQKVETAMKDPNKTPREIEKMQPGYFYLKAQLRVATEEAQKMNKIGATKYAEGNIPYSRIQQPPKRTGALTDYQRHQIGKPKTSAEMKDAIMRKVLKQGEDSLTEEEWNIWKEPSAMEKMVMSIYPEKAAALGLGRQKRTVKYTNPQLEKAGKYLRDNKALDTPANRRSLLEKGIIK